jgi:hypothetical protein
MMQTADLIEHLAESLRPLSGRAAALRLSIGLLAGAVLALGALVLLLGVRSDFADALLTMAFWRKWLYVASAALTASWLCMRLARPERSPGRLPGALMLLFVVLSVLALVEILEAPRGERVEMWLGGSALKCPWLIGALSLPIFAGVLWAFRRFAPTRLRLAGFGAGLLSGAVAATLYSFHCNETAASFVATWYTVGMLLPAILGWALGPRLLRW